MWWFLKLVIEGTVGFVTAKLGQEAGNLAYKLLIAQWDYFWAKAEEGYFLDFPEDQDRENNLRNLIKRVLNVLNRYYGIRVVENN